MAKQIQPSQECLEHHLAVRMKDYIVTLNDIQTDIIWVYNLWTEQWTKHKCLQSNGLPPLLSVNEQCAVGIGSKVYVFGTITEKRIMTNMLKVVTRMEDDSFLYRIVDKNYDTIQPSPRAQHSAWEYKKKLWVFGGSGLEPAADVFLNNYGDFQECDETGMYLNNQLLCYYPSRRIWKDVRCFGDRPSPRRYACTTIFNNEVWLFGGYDVNHTTKDFYKLNMCTFTWTRIDTNLLEGHFVLVMPAISVITAGQILVHGGSMKTGSTRIFDVESNKLRNHSVQEPNPRMHHTVTAGVHNDVVILGGAFKAKCNRHCNQQVVYTMRLGPKSLKQLAMKTVSSHRDILPWKRLPTTLTNKLIGI